MDYQDVLDNLSMNLKIEHHPPCEYSLLLLLLPAYSLYHTPLSMAFWPSGKSINKLTSFAVHSMLKYSTASICLV